MKHKNFLRPAAFGLIVLFGLTLTGCGALDQWTAKFKNSFLGNGGKLTVYDAWGNNTLTLNQVGVSIGVLPDSEVLDLQVDGHQVLHVGSTMLFAEQGLAALEDFDYEYLKRVTGENKATYIPLERNLNAFQNKLGKKRVVVVKSQMGIVVGLYEGNTVAVSVPANLPKTTLVTIDGKALYIHRADYEVLDAALLK
ncbi:MAG: DUF5052 family protein [Spirochaetales bacterium]